MLGTSLDHTRINVHKDQCPQDNFCPWHSLSPESHTSLAALVTILSPPRTWAQQGDKAGMGNCLHPSRCHHGGESVLVMRDINLGVKNGYQVFLPIDDILPSA